MSAAAHIQSSLEEILGHLAAHPNQGRRTDKPATAVVERGLRCRAHGPDGAVLISDMPQALGGEGSAPTPGWFLRAALASCDATVIAMRAAQLGVSLTELEVTVDSESDARGLLGVDDSVCAGALSMRTRVRIGAAGTPPERLRQIVHWAAAHSPVGDAVRRAVPARTEIEIV